MLKRVWATLIALLAAILVSAEYGPAKVDSVALQSTRPSDAGATTQPAPTSRPAAEVRKRFPTPAELMARLKRWRQQEEVLPKVAYFELGRPLLEKPADFSWFANPQSTLTLQGLVDRLEQARQDKQIRAVLITLGNTGLNLSQAMEVRAELDALRRAGKRTFVYADAYDTTSYLAACGATDLCMLEGGEIMIPGVGFEAMFAKGLLDKIGVKADFVQIGEYKGADEELTRTEASPELRGELNKLADSLYEQIIDTISLSRNLSHAQVEQIVDDALITGREAKDRGLVDHLVQIDQLRDLLADELGQKVSLVRHYGEMDREQVDLSSPFAFFAMLSRRPPAATRDGIGLIYAEGVIVDGRSEEGLFGDAGTIGSDDLRQALRVAQRDAKIKAVVIRIDSPGGSALASEAMWQAVRRLAKSKPVVVSVGSMAASGGYYLACSSDDIFADPTAIVGSIGVVGGKLVFTDLFTKLGLNTESFERGRNADLFSSSKSWDERQRRQITNWMRQTYDQFTERVMATRNGKIKDIDAVARGRIFSAKQAKDLGMVDQIGGVRDAIAYAAKQTDLKSGEYDVRVLPAPKTLSDLFNGAATDDDDDAATPIHPSMEMGPDGLLGALAVLPPSIRQALGQQLRILALLQQRPVVLACPYVLIVR